MRIIAALALLIAIVAGGWFALAPSSSASGLSATSLSKDGKLLDEQGRELSGDHSSMTAEEIRAKRKADKAKASSTVTVSSSATSATNAASAAPRPSAGGSATALAANSKALETINRIKKFELGEGWAEIVELVKNGGGDAEAKYLASRALEICNQQKGDANWLEKQKENVIKQIAPNDPQRDTRITAINAMQFNHCGAILAATASAGAKGSTFNANALLQQAASLGDPKAQMFALDASLQKRGMKVEAVTESEWKNMQDALNSQDPAAIRRVGMIMSGLAGNQGMAYGPDGQFANRQVAMSAWTLAACDAGLPCGPESALLVNACGYSAQCNASNVEQLYSQYQLSPTHYSQVQQLRAVISEAIRTNRWDWVGLTPGSRPIKR
jgi:hypothetical protein